MNQNDINRTFTEKVTELLGRGYQIYPGTMGGSQGEIAHVDLYNQRLNRLPIQKQRAIAEKYHNGEMPWKGENE